MSPVAPSQAPYVSTINTEAGSEMKQQRNIVVAAHPDDEILWFSGLLRSADLIIICYSGPSALSQKRADVLEILARKLPIHCLDLPDIGTWGKVEQAYPRLTSYGVALANSSLSRRYVENYFALRELLPDFLKSHDRVFCHNPWGEYGHPDHIQVYRAVVGMCLDETSIYGLTAELPFVNVWKDLYYGEIPSASSITVESDRGLFEEIRGVYLDRGAWTFDAHYHPPVREEYFLMNKQSWPEERFNYTPDLPGSSLPNL